MLKFPLPPILIIFVVSITFLVTLPLSLGTLLWGRGGGVLAISASQAAVYLTTPRHELNFSPQLTQTQAPTLTPPIRPTYTPTPSPTLLPGQEPVVKVAFFADQILMTPAAADLIDLTDYTNPSQHESIRILKLIRAEGADIALHQGDLDYQAAGKAIPEKWNSFISAILGPDYPVFVVRGNHDYVHWDDSRPDSNEGLVGKGYREILTERYQAYMQNPAIGPYLNCSFAENNIAHIGLMMSCTYRNISFVMSAVGELEDPTQIDKPDNQFENYLKTSLEQSTTQWRICAWHRVQRLLQTSNKSDEAGWKPYEYCREAGALILTAHDHSYARTYLMKSFNKNLSSDDIASLDGTTINLQEGQTVAIVSGLGGKSLRFPVSKLDEKPWWAATLTQRNYPIDQNRGGGVLFCNFNTNTTNTQAYCYFKTIEGTVEDSFYLSAQDIPTLPTPTYTPTPTATPEPDPSMVSIFLPVITLQMSS